MSRAFVREGDAPSAAPPPPRQVSGEPNLVTPRGAQLIDARIAETEAELATSPADEEAARLRRDLEYWTLRRATARLVEPDPNPRAAGFGTRVTIRRGILMSDVRIVGEDEADPARGRIAWTAPLARALEGAVRGEVVELEAGGRLEEVRVLAVHPGDR
ncbi:MAG: GreA/GreB family elongation factor [Pseudomonadota bacterium]|nr:GreA/GreB family elongation factor [Pseudomonadota bacterium]